MRILINDHSGHAFTYALCSELAGRGHRVHHAYCSRVLTPKGEFNDASVVSHPIASSRTFEKYKLRKRVIDELKYGLRSARLARHVKPDRLVVANMPLLAVLVMWVSCALSRTKCVLWLQDIQAGLAQMVLGRRSLMTRGLGVLERFLIRRSWRVVAISDEFRTKALEYGADAERVSVVENWAPIAEIPAVSKVNEWSRAHGLDDRFVFVYSGTLALKHNPQMLLDLADGFRDDDRVRVVVVSEGVGADWLQSAVEAQPRGNLQLLPFQPFERLAEVLGTADVLVAVLEREAGMYSVPSKVLAYLCAGRPILGSIPAENAAARMVARRAHAGICVAPNDPEAFLEGAKQLRTDDRLRQQLGSNARRFAEATFDRRRIAERFEAILHGANEPAPRSLTVAAGQ